MMIYNGISGYIHLWDDNGPHQRYGYIVKLGLTIYLVYMSPRYVYSNNIIRHCVC